MVATSGSLSMIPRPLACFTGIWTNWTSVRKVKEGETTNDIFAFLTTEPNAGAGAIHPKAMPVILTTPSEVETGMTAPVPVVNSIVLAVDRETRDAGTRC
jgi:putative SOS response-associated peptidase YedK